jgi:hypothetical protein
MNCPAESGLLPVEAPGRKVVVLAVSALPECCAEITEQETPCAFT